MATPIEPFIPEPDIRERHTTQVRAPAAVVMETAREFDLQSLAPVRWIIRLREILLGAKAPAGDHLNKLVEATRAMGWGVLVDQPGSLYIAGAECQPWLADVVFTPIAPDRFATYAEPDRVKIAWTLEVESLGPDLARFSTETRAAGTDAEAKKKFRAYWRRFGIGIIVIRLLLVPALKRAAERRWRAGESRG